MNDRLRNVYLALVAALVAVLGAVIYWQIWAAPDLAARQRNPRLVFHELAVERGRIVAADGTVLATNRAQRANGRTLWYRTYPSGNLASHLVGYSSVQASRAGLENSLNDYLTGATTDLRGGLDRLGGRLNGEHVKGNDVVLSLSAPAQRAALNGLRATGLRGAVIAIEPSTGRILVMASWPTFNPNRVDRDFARLGNAPGAPLFNRATQGRYPPGSALKVVTAATALESGRYTPESTFKGGSCIFVSEEPKVFRDLCNAGDETAPDNVSLADSLVYSYNTTFARLGLDLGQARLLDTLARFGIGTTTTFDFPRDEIADSGVFNRKGALVKPGKPIDVASAAIGQGGVLTTPLAMAMVAATVANGGRLVAPRAVDRVVAPDGHTLLEPGTTDLGEAISPSTAAALAQMMTSVVEEGTGQEAQIGGISVAGKTGTAQTGRENENVAWFIAFAPVESPTVAIAVVVEGTPGYGGTVAAPIARDVLTALGLG